MRIPRVDAPPTLLASVLVGAGLADTYDERPSPIGPVFVAWNPLGVSAVAPAAEGPEAFEAGFAARFGRPAVSRAAPPRLASALDRALETGRSARLRFDLRGSTRFAVDVLRACATIPPGSMRSYGWIARRIARPKAVRAVGSALAHNPIPLLIPCHRVVRGDGAFGNYGLGPDTKRALLEREGAVAT